ncbi:MAG: hypothetical protein A2X25_04245 [Chloroflexi bacterium GWB2_49_20]|nr:MAG: hypothetical protein A2X25_04245 [Chloroflexi bacterium GWB2_49_20]OGN77881.1 MAG: hypothetical protein A2X26_01965 [Chloroflexi bacterium GWC2_49_37]OGN82738.1 MAG: hypothetical protein A2X27_09065 [Chloroflexi bacterium GWD2_49_16]HCM96132.1 hypothetical protein [Anaerolineae bacterium]
MRRNYLFWGIVLVAFGGIFFLNAMDRLPGNALGYFWQLFLIILGSWVIINSIWIPGREGKENFSVSLQGAACANIHITHGAGRVNITSGANLGELLTCISTGTTQQKTRLSNGTLDVRISPGSDIMPLVGFAEGFNWDLALSDAIPISLTLETGASQTMADLSDLYITDLKISTGASTTSITLPGKPELAYVSINAGVATLDIKIPENVAAKIRMKDGLTSLNLDNNRFTRIEGNRYESQNYNQSTQRSEITIEAGVGSITIH